MAYFIKFFSITIIFCICYIFSDISLKAQQNITISYADSTIALGDTLKILITAEINKITSISNFPEIEDFIKGNTYFNKIKQDHYLFEQHYFPRKAGSFTINPFNLGINASVYRFNQQGIQVSAGAKNFYKAPLRVDSSDFFQPELNIHFNIEADKQRMFVGEGFKFQICFYKLKSSKAEINFIDLNDQLKEIINKSKPTNCWEEKLTNAQSIQVDSVVQDKKVYTRYLFYSSIYYPIDSMPIEFKAVNFKLLTYKVKKSKNKIERFAFYIELKSPFVKISVLPTPLHPLKNKIPAGNFTMTEKLSSTSLKVGEPLKYQFSIKSDYGATLIHAPTPIESKNFNIFTSSVNLNNTETGYGGETKYDYQIVFRKQGSYHLQDMFQWIYFNTKKFQYDTLKSKSAVLISSQEMTGNNKLGMSAFYESMLQNANNSISYNEKEDRIRLIANIAIILMLLGTIILVVKK